MTTLTFHLARALGRSLGPGDAIVVTELDHHANIDPWRALERERGVDRPPGEDGPRDRPARLGRPGPLPDRSPHPAAGDRGGVQRAGNDQRRRPGRGHGPRGRGADVRRRRALRAAPARRRPGMGLRLPGLLGLQVLRPARRRALRPTRAARGPRRPEARARARDRPPSGWRPGRRTTRGSSAPRPRWTISPRWPTTTRRSEHASRRERLRAVFDALHDRGCVAARPALGRPERHRRRPAVRASAGCAADADALLHGRRPARRRGQPRPGRPGDLRLARRFLRDDRRPPAGRRRARHGPHRLCLLHDRRRRSTGSWTASGRSRAAEISGRWEADSWTLRTNPPG